MDDVWSVAVETDHGTTWYLLVRNGRPTGARADTESLAYEMIERRQERGPDGDGDHAA